VSLGWRKRCLFELERFEGAAQLSAKSFDGQLMIGALRQAGNSHGTDAPRTYDAQGKTAAVAGIIRQREPVAIKQVRLFLFQLSSYGIGTAMEARHHITLAANPFDVIGGCAGQCGVKQRLTEAPDVDDKAVVASDGQSTNAAAQFPGCFLVEANELKFLFLEGNTGDVFTDGHVCCKLL
jgi:hypothetical protein